PSLCRKLVRCTLQILDGWSIACQMQCLSTDQFGDLGALAKAIQRFLTDLGVEAHKFGIDDTEVVYVQIQVSENGCQFLPPRMHRAHVLAAESLHFKEPESERTDLSERLNCIIYRMRVPIFGYGVQVCNADPH